MAQFYSLIVIKILVSAWAMNLVCSDSRFPLEEVLNVLAEIKQDGGGLTVPRPMPELSEGDAVISVSTNTTTIQGSIQGSNGTTVNETGANGTAINGTAVDGKEPVLPVVGGTQVPIVIPNRPTYYPSYPIPTSSPLTLQQVFEDLQRRVERLERLSDLWRDNFHKMRQNFRRLLRRVNQLS